MATTPDVKPSEDLVPAIDPTLAVKPISQSHSVVPLTPISAETNLKRERDDQDYLDVGISPAKRMKMVHFDDANLTQAAETAGRTLEFIKTEVKQALERHRRGEDAAYLELREVFKSSGKPSKTVNPEDLPLPHELVSYVVALTAYAHLLDRSCSDLVKTVLYCSPIGRDDSFHLAYCQFVAAVVGRYGIYLLVSCDMVWIKQPGADTVETARSGGDSSALHPIPITARRMAGVRFR
jgi:hypothetical protein